MAVTIENQHIGKRYKSPYFRHSNKSAGFDTGFMSQFNQKPVRKKKRASSSFFDNFGRTTRTDYKRARYQTIYARGSSSVRSANHENQRKKTYDGDTKKSAGGFSIPIPSVATLAVIAGTILIALTALNWEDINIMTPEKYVFQPVTAEDAEYRAMLYASTGVSNIIRQQNATAELDSLLNPVITDDIEEPQSSLKSDSPLDELLITFQWQSYRVQKGDTVSGIAKKYNVSVGAIFASNEIGNARRLQEGAVLRIPNIDGIPYSIKRGDSLSAISASFNVPLDVILDVNDIKSDVIRAGDTIFIPGARMNDMDLRLSMGELFIYPVQSRYITSNYGMRKDPISGHLAYHNGIDLRGNTGSTVMAALDGVVSVVSENWLYGKYIILSHSNGYKTLYAHLNSTSVKQGDRVVSGRKVGEVGNTGYSTGPHLHFGIYNKDGKALNPLDLLH